MTTMGAVKMLKYLRIKDKMERRAWLSVSRNRTHSVFSTVVVKHFWVNVLPIYTSCFLCEDMPFVTTAIKVFGKLEGE